MHFTRLRLLPLLVIMLFIAQGLITAQGMAIMLQFGVQKGDTLLYQLTSIQNGVPISTNGTLPPIPPPPTYAGIPLQEQQATVGDTYTFEIIWDLDYFPAEFDENSPTAIQYVHSDPFYSCFDGDGVDLTLTFRDFILPIEGILENGTYLDASTMVKLHFRGFPITVTYKETDGIARINQMIGFETTLTYYIDLKLGIVTYFHKKSSWGSGDFPSSYTIELVRARINSTQKEPFALPAPLISVYAALIMLVIVSRVKPLK